MFPFVGDHLYVCCVCLQYEHLKGKSTLNVAGVLALELDSGIAGARKKFEAEHFDPWTQDSSKDSLKAHKHQEVKLLSRVPPITLYFGEEFLNILLGTSDVVLNPRSRCSRRKEMQQLFSNMANMAGCIRTGTPRKCVSAYCQYYDAYLSTFPNAWLVLGHSESSNISSSELVIVAGQCDHVPRSYISCSLKAKVKKRNTKTGLKQLVNRFLKYSREHDRTKSIDLTC